MISEESQEHYKDSQADKSDCNHRLTEQEII